jgi:hypothetical protein
MCFLRVRSVTEYPSNLRSPLLTISASLRRTALSFLPVDDDRKVVGDGFIKVDEEHHQYEFDK